MNNSRLPFTIAQSFRALARDLPLANPPEHAITDHEICVVCSGLFIVVAAIVGAYLGFYL